MRTHAWTIIASRWMISWLRKSNNAIWMHISYLRIYDGPFPWMRMWTRLWMKWIWSMMWTMPRTWSKWAIWFMWIHVQVMILIRPLRNCDRAIWKHISHLRIYDGRTIWMHVSRLYMSIGLRSMCAYKIHEILKRLKIFLFKMIYSQLEFGYHEARRCTLRTTVAYMIGWCNWLQYRNGKLIYFIFWIFGSVSFRTYSDEDYVKN